jgi:uncharacterized protein YggU (UPF0235/DUF167 family)
VPSSARFAIQVVPRGGTDRVEGVVDGSLRARVAAPAVEGAANASLIRLIARELDIPRGRIRVVTGVTSRRKVLEVDGLDAAALTARWPGLDV